MLFCDVWGQSSFEVLYSLLEKGKASLWAYGGWGGGSWIGFCVFSKPYKIVHCVYMWILLTRFDSFLLLDRTISSRHLTHYSRDVLSDAGQIGKHLPQCVDVCVVVNTLCVCMWVWVYNGFACMYLRMCKRWIEIHEGSGAIWCLAWHEKTCLEWDRLSACAGFSVH